MTGHVERTAWRRVAGPVRGRSAELKSIGERVAAVSDGRGGVLVIEGPPGIGKSRLLAEGRSAAESRGVRTLCGQAFEYQQTVPFFSLFTATLHADPPIGDAETLRRLSGSADLSYWVIHDMSKAIYQAAATTPLMITLEDIHWADTGTLSVLRSLAGARPDVPVLWAVTVRTGSGGCAVQETLDELERADARFVRLTALPEPAVVDMIQDAVRAKADESLLKLAVKAHGNPFLVNELVIGLGEEGRLSLRGGTMAATGDGLPRRLGATMRQRLDMLSATAREVVRVSAVLPDRFTVRLVAAMLERQPASLTSAFEEAIRADLLIEDDERLRFQHDLVREATRRSMPQSLRRAMERQSVSMMLELGVSPVEVATQLARSAERGDREAIGALREAAQSVSQTDPGAAAELSKQALELLLAEEDRGALVAETVLLLNKARRYVEAEDLAVAALAGAASPEEEAEIRLRLPAFTKHTTQQRVEENRRALGLHEIGDVTRARHMALLAYNLMLDDKYGQHRAAAHEARVVAESTSDNESMIVADVTLAMYDCADGFVDQALGQLSELCVLAQPMELTAAHVMALTYHANLLAVVGRLVDAAAEVASGIEQASRANNAMALEIWATVDGMVSLSGGRLAAARVAVESVPSLEPAGATELDLMRLLTLAQIGVHTDDRSLLQHAAGYARAAYPSGASAVRRYAAHVLALAAWHCDDLNEAMRWLSGDITLFGTPLTPQALDRLVLGARVAAAAGDAGLRASVLQAADVLARERDVFPLFDGIADFVHGVIDRDTNALVGAAQRLRTCAMPLLHASAAEQAGIAFARADRREEALDQLTTSFDTYLRSDALADARRVRRELRRLGVDRRILSQPRAKSGWESLTDSELRVINLVASGATNTAIAAKLQISRNTVKTHVHNAFSKLGIVSRAELTLLGTGQDEGVG